jgi:hypothetical protein
MNRQPHLLTRRRGMLPLLVIGLLASHGIILYYVSSQVVLSAAVLLGAIIVLVIKHVGLLGPLYSRFRRRHWGHRP